MSEGTTLKPTNPKDAIGSDKLPLHLWPNTASALGCLGLLDGMLKYGRSNFRAIGVRSSIYYDAAKRHLDAWFEGEDADPDSGLPHLAHALACLAIIVDAEAAGKLNDDRMFPGGWRKLVAELTPEVKRLKELHASKNPKHYTREEPKPVEALEGRAFDTSAPKGATAIVARCNHSAYGVKSSGNVRTCAGCGAVLEGTGAKM